MSKSESSNELRETLSSLMDGELPGEGARASCSRWRVDAEARDAWHTYQLIGDVLRSDDLASTPVRDEAFLQRLRGRLAQEPVPMAPLPAAARAAVAPAAAVAPVAALVGAAPVGQRRLSRRLAPMAVAAGIVVVAGVVGVMRAAGPGSAEQPLMASGFNAGLGGESSASMPAGAVPVTMVRDARLDRYIAAHRKLANGIAVPDRAGAPVAVVYESR
ncbi:sigma-E factor negative regulatory protein [Ideonella sp. DXS22W]|uniref:Sigma-E factor negative regulatory protein n=1 Tax=Pseudaquabacterium inlustre TaxID=2984192 RepID=A0ABU9CDF4_9BURK